MPNLVRLINRISCAILYNNIGIQYDGSCSDDEEIEDEGEVDDEEKKREKYINLKTPEELKLEQQQAIEREHQRRLKNERVAREAEQQAIERQAREAEAAAGPAGNDLDDDMPPLERVSPEGDKLSKVNEDDSMFVLERRTTTGLAEMVQKALTGDEYAEQQVFALVKDDTSLLEGFRTSITELLKGKKPEEATEEERSVDIVNADVKDLSQTGASLLEGIGKAFGETTEGLSKAVTGLFKKEEKPQTQEDDQEEKPQPGSSIFEGLGTAVTGLFNKKPKEDQVVEAPEEERSPDSGRAAVEDQPAYVPLDESSLNDDEDKKVPEEKNSLSTGLSAFGKAFASTTDSAAESLGGVARRFGGLFSRGPILDLNDGEEVK